MSVVLGVDSSLTISGCALVRFGDGPDAADPVWETWRGRTVAAEVETVETLRRRIRVMLREILAIVPPRLTLSVVEGPAMSAKYTPLADERAGLRWMLIDQLMARGPVALVSPISRQALSGVGTIPRGTKGPQRKRMVTAAVVQMLPGVHVPDHNVADAVALAAAGAHRVGLRMPYSVKQEKAHANVAWPVESVA
ncbi:hypothetical protein ACI3KS_05315 [Microbacterium sp. ZW T5_45]|uniref:hypothetical protein n=1 Tax=Microbacterium sp. ZW T5_45 TaxID=3378080 RepID=UPI00385190D8